jgi:hypothetical protein
MSQQRESRAAKSREISATPNTEKAIWDSKLLLMLPVVRIAWQRSAWSDERLDAKRT